MKEFDYSSENIFRTMENDYFERNFLLIHLIDLIMKSNKSEIIAIDAPWGAGKTVFAKQLEELFRSERNEWYSEKCKTYDYEPSKVEEAVIFYFNAWEHDAVGNPVLSLLYFLSNESKLFSAEEKKELSDKLIPLINIGIKAITLGMFSKDDFTNSNSETIYNDIFSLNKIKDLLNETVESIKKSKAARKVIIIVDELDRCKPSYAVNLLESFKHFYENDSLTFILTTNCDQLTHTIKKHYGIGFDADMYLQRFFDGFMTLDTPDVNEYIKTELDITSDSLLMGLAQCIIEDQKLSLRDMKKCFNKVNIVKNHISKDYNSCSFKTKEEIINLIAKELFVPLALCLKCVNIKEYHRFISGEFKSEEIVSIFLNDKTEEIVSQYREHFSRVDSSFEKEEIPTVIHTMYLFIFYSNASEQMIFKDNKKTLYLENLKKIDKGVIKRLISV